MTPKYKKIFAEVQGVTPKAVWLKPPNQEVACIPLSLLGKASDRFAIKEEIGNSAYFFVMDWKFDEVGWEED